MQNQQATDYQEADDMRQCFDEACFFNVRQQTTPNLTYAIGPGVARINGKLVKYAGGNTSTFTAPVLNPRIDLIYIDDSGTLGYVTGTEAASPTAPDYPDDKLVIAEIYHRAAETSLKWQDDSTNGYVYRFAGVKPSEGGTDVFTYGETISANDALYFKRSDQRVYKADASTLDESQGFVGFAIEAGSAADEKLIKRSGLLSGFTSLTAGSEYYLSDTAGAISTTPGTYDQPIGFAVSTTELFIYTKTANNGHVPRTQVFTSSGTFTKPLDVDIFRVICVGGGGAGGTGSSGTNYCGGGGGAGAYCEEIVNLQGVTSVTVTVGAGGDDSAGGDTTFGSYMTAGGGAKGGNGQTSTSGIGGDGGTATGGDINCPGGDGHNAIREDGATSFISGHGGSSFFGGGAKGVNSDSVGNNAEAYGAGGSGGYGAATGNEGGEGKQGIVIIYW